MKKCFRCGEERTLGDFYRHPQMGDGHLNKCKDCTRLDSKKRQDRLFLDMGWRESEKSRSREKYHRLNYRVKYKPTKRYKKMVQRKYIDTYPEKRLAKNASQRMKIEKGFQKHHWSYNKEHYRDIFELLPLEHAKLHRYMIYDQERMMYRDTSGILLDTKLKHREHLESIKDKP